MAERITWEQIDASPLLALPCEERARLRETGDERFRAFWDTCYRAYVAKEPDTDGIAFSITFIKVFTSYQPNPEKPGQTFSIYLRSAVNHAQAKSRAADTSAVSRFSRETNRKIKAALEYMADNGLDMGQVCNDSELLSAAAVAASVSPKTLHIALQERQALMHLDDTEGAQADLPDAEQEDVALQVEHKQTLSLLHRGISLMNLKAKRISATGSARCSATACWASCGVKIKRPPQRTPLIAWPPAMSSVRWKRTTACGTSC